MASRHTANLMAAAAFFVVLIVGVWVVGANHSVEPPTSTTVVTKSPTTAGSTSTKSTRVVVNAKGKPTTKTTTRTKVTTPASPETTEKTTVNGGRSFFERILGDDGIVFLQVGIVLIAAFIAGAAIQRVLVGQYGGVKVGPLGVSEIAGTSVRSAETLEAGLEKLHEETSAKLGELEARVRAVYSQSSLVDSKLSADLSVIAQRLDDAEKQLRT